jgi:hypothetical protein
MTFTPYLATFLGTCSLLLAGCTHSSTPEPTLLLPPATAVGANTLGFQVDGRVWTTYGQTCVFSGPCRDNTLLASVGRRPGGLHTLLVTTQLNTEQYVESFLLQLDSVKGLGIYRCSPQFTGLVSPIPSGFSLQDNKTTEATQRLSLSTATASRIVLTQVDTVHRIMAGTFEGQLRQTWAPYVTSQLTQGRFDIHY